MWRAIRRLPKPCRLSKPVAYLNRRKNSVCALRAGGRAGGRAAGRAGVLAPPRTPTCTHARPHARTHARTRVPPRVAAAAPRGASGAGRGRMRGPRPHVSVRRAWWADGVAGGPGERRGHSAGAHPACARTREGGIACGRASGAAPRHACTQTASQGARIVASRGLARARAAPAVQSTYSSLPRAALGTLSGGGEVRG